MRYVALLWLIFACFGTDAIHDRSSKMQIKSLQEQVVIANTRIAKLEAVQKPIIVTPPLEVGT